MSTPEARCSGCRFFLWSVVVLILLGALGAAIRFLPDRAVTHDDPVEHFKYGSTGGERNMGFPYWLFQVLPEVCPELLPGKGYASLGFIFEPGRDLPVGMSKRRHLGIDRVFLNCAVCHTATVRTAPGVQPLLVAGMPANQLDLMGFQKFVQQCVNDRRFTPALVVPRIEEKVGGLGLLDKRVIYPLAIHLMRDGVAGLLGRLRFIHVQADWGPGRVDTFNSAKAIFGVPFEQLSPEELVGVSDFPAIWNQGKKQGMQLHWDGNNSRVEERNLSAAFGTGATPKLIDHAAIARIEAWIATATPPAFEEHYPIDDALATRGKALYEQSCAAATARTAAIFPANTSARSRRSTTSAPIAAVSIPTRCSSRRTRACCIRPTRIAASAISARPGATPTPRSTASGCARPTCTTARFQACGTCCSPPRSAQKPSTAATTCTTPGTSASSPTKPARTANPCSPSTPRCPATATPATKARPTAPRCRMPTSGRCWNT
jgi:mono/diheme cytochrome c family protein